MKVKIKIETSDEIIERIPATAHPHDLTQSDATVW